MGFLAYLGTRFTGRTSVVANQRSTEIEKDANAVEGYARLLAEYRQDHAAYRERLDKMERKVDEQESEITTLSRKLDTYLRRYRDAIKYIVQLRNIIAERLPGELIPEPPETLLLDIDGRDAND